LAGWIFDEPEDKFTEKAVLGRRCPNSPEIITGCQANGEKQIILVMLKKLVFLF
jgi:hypothetical protein